MVFGSKKQQKSHVDNQPSFSIAESMRRDLQRYSQLRQHQSDESAFKEQLHLLQQWQIERLKFTHRALLQSPSYQAPTEFILTEVYGGIDLSELVGQIERAMTKALKLFPEKVMGTAALALEFNALTAELDEAMAEILFEDFKVTAIDSDAYVSAYRQLDNFSVRRRQIELGDKLAKNIDKYVQSKLLFGAFKVAKKPAMASGYGALYGFMERGFEVLRPIDSTHKLLSMIAEPETSFVSRIEQGDNNPYDLDSTTQIAI